MKNNIHRIQMSLIRPRSFHVGIVGKLLIVSSILVFLVFFGAFLAHILLGMEYDEGFWWAWTHIIDPGFIEKDGDKSYIRKILGSIMIFLGVIIYAGVFLTIFSSILENTVKYLKQGRVPKWIEGHTVIASNEVQSKYYIDAVNRISSNADSNIFVMVISEQKYFEQIKENADSSIFIANAKIGIPEAQSRLQLKKAKRIIILDDFGGEFSEVLNLISQLNLDRIASKPDKELKFYIEVKNRKLLPKLQIAIHQLIKHEALIEVYLINSENNSARLALLNYPLESDKNNDKPGNQVTLIIKGWSDFAEALLQQVLRIGHYTSSTRIILATDNPTKMQAKLNQDYPGMLGAEYIRQTVNVECIDFHSVDFVEIKDGDQLTIDICGKNCDEIFVQAMEYAASDIRGLKQVFAEFPDSSGYRDFFNQVKYAEGNVPVFPVDSHAQSFELMEQLDTFAKTSHQNYINIREYQGERIKNDNGEYVNPADNDWKNLDETCRGWNRSPADHLRIKLNALAVRNGIEEWDCSKSGIQFDIKGSLIKKVLEIVNSVSDKNNKNEDLEFLAELEHNRWVGEKIVEGWSLGDHADKKRKISNLFVPYKDLDVEVKLYDRKQVVTQLFSLIDKGNSDQ